MPPSILKQKLEVAKLMLKYNIKVKKYLMLDKFCKKIQKTYWQRYKKWVKIINVRRDGEYSVAG